MRCFLLLALLLFFPACNATLVTPGGATISVRGRVVNAETCASAAGCTGVEGMIVSLLAEPDRVRSQPTGPDGTFELDGVLVGYPHDMIVSPDETVTEPWAPTLNPMVVRRDVEDDLFGVELFVLPRDPQSLLEGIRAEGVDLVQGGGYVGQVVRTDGTTVTAAQGVSVAVAPQPLGLYYVRRFPRFVPEATTVLFEPGVTTTGAFGTFVVQPDGETDPAAFQPLEAGWEYELVVGPMLPGFVTYAVHRGVAL